MAGGNETGAWVAYHHDWSGFALFPTEILALRYAMENRMEVGLGATI